MLSVQERKEHRNIASKKCYQNHKEKYKTNRRLFYQKHRIEAIEYSKIFYKGHKKCYNQNERNNRNKKKTIVLDHYGCFCHNPDCPIPKEKMDKNCLQIDHINDDGNEDRIKINTKHWYEWIIKNNFPIDLQVLCVYCNWQKRYLKNNQNL